MDTVDGVFSFQINPKNKYEPAYEILILSCNNCSVETAKAFRQACTGSPVPCCLHTKYGCR